MAHTHLYYTQPSFSCLVQTWTMHQRPRTVKLYFMDFTVRRFDTYLCFFLHKNSALIPPEQYPFKVSVSTIPTCNIYTFFLLGKFTNTVLSVFCRNIKQQHLSSRPDRGRNLFVARVNISPHSCKSNASTLHYYSFHYSLSLLFLKTCPALSITVKTTYF